MPRTTEFLVDKYFGNWEHPYRRFERHVDSLLCTGDTLLDIGCGRTAPVLHKFRSRGVRLIGIDRVAFDDAPDELDLRNVDITETGLPGQSISVAMARSVMEHVAEPQQAYSEIYRILKPGGHFVFLTANLWDYASLAACVVPNRWHPRIVRFMEGRSENDVFPTEYKSNTRRNIYSHAAKTGFDVALFEYLGQYPSYFMFNTPLFLVATAYEKMLARYQYLHFLRGWILAVLRRPC